MRPEPVNPFPEGNYDMEGIGGDYIDPEKASQQIQALARRNFIKKVYGILTAQLTITTGFVVALVASGATDAFRSSTGQFNVAGQVVFYICISVVLVISIIMTCFLNVARKYPLNYVLLAIFTIAEGLILSVVAANVYAGTVITVGIVTLTMTGFLTMYAILSKREITMAGTAGVLFFWLVLLVITMSFLYIWAWNYSAVFTYVLIGMVFLYGFFIVWDTKLLVGQKRSGIQLNLDDYILGALLLYTDIIGLFLNLLSLLTRIHH